MRTRWRGKATVGSINGRRGWEVVVVFGVEEELWSGQIERTPGPCSNYCWPDSLGSRVRLWVVRQLHRKIWEKMMVDYSDGNWHQFGWNTIRENNTLSWLNHKGTTFSAGIGPQHKVVSGKFTALMLWQSQCITLCKSTDILNIIKCYCSMQPDDPWSPSNQVSLSSHYIKPIVEWSTRERLIVLCNGSYNIISFWIIGQILKKPPLHGAHKSDIDILMD